MSINKLPNLGSKGWGNSLNNYMEDVSDRVTEIENHVNEIATTTVLNNVSSGVMSYGGVGQGSVMMKGSTVLKDADIITDGDLKWRGEIFFKDRGDGTPLTYEANIQDATLSLSNDMVDFWNPVYAYIMKEGDEYVFGYSSRTDLSYIVHPLYVLLGFVFRTGGESINDPVEYRWYYKTSRSNVDDYNKRIMLNRVYAKMNTTFEIKKESNKAYILGKVVWDNPPTFPKITLNAMGINHYNDAASSSALDVSSDYKEYNVRYCGEETDINGDEIDINYNPVIHCNNDTVLFSLYGEINLDIDNQSIHRVFVTNVEFLTDINPSMYGAMFIVQTKTFGENESIGTDYSSVLSYPFNPLPDNIRKYGDVVELFRFITDMTTEEEYITPIYQVVDNGIPPTNSFGINPEINFISREEHNNIQFLNSSGEGRFSLVGQNYNGTPKLVRFNFNHSDDEYNNYHALMNYTDISTSTTGRILFKGYGTTSYIFDPVDLNLTMSEYRYIRMGGDTGFPSGIQLKNSDGSITINNSGIINLRYGNYKGLQVGSTALVQGVKLFNDSGSLFLDDDGSIQIDNGNVVITMNNDISLDSTEDINLDSDNNINLTSNSINLNSSNNLLLTSPNTGILSNRITLQNSLANTVIFENGELYGYYVGNAGENKWWLNSDHGYFSGLKVGSRTRKLVLLDNVKLTSNMGTILVSNGPTVLRWESEGKYYFICSTEKQSKIIFYNTYPPETAILEGVWSGNFPIFVTHIGGDNPNINLIGLGAYADTGNEDIPWAIKFWGLKSDGTIDQSPALHEAVITNFYGWAWEVVSSIGI